MAKIILKNIAVHFPIYRDYHYSLRRGLIRCISNKAAFKMDQSITIIQALKNISFALYKGDRLGLVGNNGAGKSTLLKTMGGLYQPTQGTLQVEGKTSTLFDVCMGMDIERTGYSNIHYIGMLLGLSRAEIKQYLPNIKDFSELGEFLNMPVRTYSTGMKIRLGFAICTCINPAILLLDEAIGAGDHSFMKKAEQRAKKLYERAEILVLASHSTAVIKQFCNKALWLHQGKVMMLGNAEPVLQAYEQQKISGFNSASEESAFY